MEQPERFYYNMELEDALNQLFGYDMKGGGLEPKPGKYNHSADSFSNPSSVKNAMKDAISKLRVRIDEVTRNDDRLKGQCMRLLDSIEGEVNGITKSNPDWKIIARFLELTSILLGYDRWKGEPCRHVIYYQDHEQQMESFRKDFPDEYKKFWEGARCYKPTETRIKIVKALRKRGFTVLDIALTMKMGTTTVQKYLK